MKYFNRFFTVFVLLTCILVFMGFSLQEEEREPVSPRSIEGDGDYNNEILLLIDGEFAPEGALRDSYYCVFWNDPATLFILDLGMEFEITGIQIQVEGNDDYRVDFSEDGTEFINLITFYVDEENPVTGMTIKNTIPDDPNFVEDTGFESTFARYVRLSATGGDSAYGAAELQVFGFSTSSGSEGEGSLLRPSTIMGVGNFTNSVNMIIDGQIPPEGVVWDSKSCVYWVDIDTHFLIDLGSLYEVTGLVFQVDANDTYFFEYSTDGEDFLPLFELKSEEGEIAEGMDTVSTIPGNPEYLSDRDFFPVEIRYLRISALEGDGTFSISEVLVYGREPEE